ncbi:4-carboxymuconolactone decarboxylase [Microbacterium sp. STN6]|uniref:bifunctional 3-oxoadipate enol-lactonase/4-carboxymuconolactone decarboxylase PcaDC n=1 Tax=Microbacterium sp. STN6 TaxID=2995588 RepID=UPI002260A371|nr:4-carboxymuconolactone decarboxylase [Microbacterium sp. STN6]MCX7522263.1 4-carboxymuconolactone decarboxylase [Microbacterium sp. STN6]
MTVPSLKCSIAPVQASAPGAQLLVLGPSLGTTSELWSAVLEQLTGDYRVLRFDLPGHGFSPATREPFTVGELADAVVELVDSVGGGAFHYAGVSLGGAIGLEVAARHPSRVLSLTVFCTGATIGTAESWRERAAQVRASGTASLVAQSASRWFAPGFLDSEADAGGATLNALLTVDDESYALCCEALAEHDMTARLGEIAAPTLCVAGEHDQATPSEKLRELARGIPNASYQQVAGVAHLPMLERPRKAAALILERTGARGHASPPARPADAHEQGMSVRRSVLGDAHVDASIAKTTPETADFQDFITRYAWGEVWSRPGLDRRSRSLLTLAALIAGGHENELGMHVRAALTNGLTRTEISEAILHTGIYAGVPAANSAFAIAREVFAAIDDKPVKG